MEIARSYFITLNLLYGKLFHTHFVQLCQGTTVVDGGSGSGSHGRGGSGSSTALDGGGYIDNRGGAHSSYDDRRHRLTVTTLVTTARARAAAVSCSAFVGGVAGVSHTGIFVCFFA